MAEQVPVSSAWKIKTQDQFNKEATKYYQGLQMNLPLPAFLVSQANREAARFDMAAIKRRYDGSEARNAKTGIAVTIEYYDPITYIDIANGDGDACATDGLELTVRTKTYSVNNKTQGKRVRMDAKYVSCIQQGQDTYKRALLVEMFKAFETQFFIEVSSEFYANRIGTFAENSPAGKNVTAFDTTAPNEASPVAETQMMVDMQDVGRSPQDLVYFGNVRAMAYLTSKKIAVANDKGFNIAMLEAINTTNINNTNWYDHSIAKNLSNEAFIGVVPGAVQLLTFNEYAGERENTEEYPKYYTLTSPLTGFTYDIVENQERCNGRVEHVFSPSICWELIGYPECDHDVPLRQGVTDVFHWNLACGTDTMCDITGAEPIQQTYTNSVPANACDNPCEPTCGVTIVANVVGTSLVLNANVSGIPYGATIAYVWEQDGNPISPVTGNDALVILTTGNYADGDVFTVDITVTDTEGNVCTAQATYTYVAPIA